MIAEMVGKLVGHIITLVTLVLVGLKTTGAITIPWVWILGPAWFLMSVGLVVEIVKIIDSIIAVRKVAKSMHRFNTLIKEHFDEALDGNAPDDSPIWTAKSDPAGPPPRTAEKKEDI